jgi:hypothetical protein
MTVKTQQYDDWAELLEHGDYGELIGLEENPYFQSRQEIVQALLPVIAIAKKNDMSIADLTKTLVTVSYKEGMLPA